MDDFHTQLIALLPRLRGWAWMLARDRMAGEDLAQETVACALRSRNGFTPGTNLRAWLYRILHNRFVSARRRQRRQETQDLDAVPEEYFAMAPQHENRLVLKELWHALQRLQPGSREALMMRAIQGLSYEEIAAATGLPLGTVKSQVHRARLQLWRWLLDEDDPAMELDWAA